MTNTFISMGIKSGLAGIALLIVLLVCCFRSLGNALAAVRVDPNARSTELMLWALGVTLAVHIINWLGITYFDQIYVVWFLQLAAISNIADYYARRLYTAQEQAHFTTEVTHDSSPEPVLPSQCLSESRITLLDFVAEA